MVKQIADNLYEVGLGVVNVHLIDLPEALILVDTGSAGNEAAIFAAVAAIGRRPHDLTHIIVTHAHSDHAGGLAAVQAQTNAVTLMHPLDAALVRSGHVLRPLKPAPGLLTRLLFRLFIASAPGDIAPARVDAEVVDGQRLAGGLRVIHAPGHSAGQIALLWEARGVLFAADAVMNQPNLRYSLAYEDFARGRQTAAHLARYDFDIACFGHGKALIGKAGLRFGRTFTRRGETHVTSGFA